MVSNAPCGSRHPYRQNRAHLPSLAPFCVCGYMRAEKLLLLELPSRFPIRQTTLTTGAPPRRPVSKARNGPTTLQWRHEHGDDRAILVC